MDTEKLVLGAKNAHVVPVASMWSSRQQVRGPNTVADSFQRKVARYRHSCPSMRSWSPSFQLHSARLAHGWHSICEYGEPSGIVNAAHNTHLLSLSQEMPCTALLPLGPRGAVVQALVTTDVRRQCNCVLHAFAWAHAAPICTWCDAIRAFPTELSLNHRRWTGPQMMLGHH